MAEVKLAKFRGRLVRLPNPSAPPACPRGRKPVAKLTDRAKRYRANAPGCRPAGPRQCVYCRARKNVGVHHLDGDESNGRKSNLAWACKSCNTRLGYLFKRAGAGARTRQYNPRGRSKGDPAFTQYAWAVNVICRRRDRARGLCDFSSDRLTKQAVEIVRATPVGLRRDYARRAASRRRPSEVPF